MEALIGAQWPLFRGDRRKEFLITAVKFATSDRGHYITASEGESMRGPKTKDRVSLSEFRAAAVAAQLLNRKSRDLGEVLEKAGFVRTLGGVDVYLALQARIPNFQARELDVAVAGARAQVIPAARGCIYLVARSQVPDTLAFAALQRASRDAREYDKAGIKKGELERVGKAVVSFLREQGPLSTTQLRSRLPQGSFRSLGEAGKKVGLSSTLPPALRQLEFEGRIERLLEGESLDSERYLWRIRSKEDVAEAAKRSAAELHRSLARVFFRAAGLATARMFAGWSGLGIRDSRAAVQDIELSAYEVEGIEEPALGFDDVAGVSPHDCQEIVALLPFEDNLIALRGGPRLLVDPAFHGLSVPIWGSSRSSSLGEATHSAMRTILAGNQVAGFWEFDPPSGKVVTHCFAALNSNQKEAVANEAGRLEAFFQEELGHARSFSLDTDQALADRADYIRSLG